MVQQDARNRRMTNLDEGVDVLCNKVAIIHNLPATRLRGMARDGGGGGGGGGEGENGIKSKQPLDLSSSPSRRGLYCRSWPSWHLLPPAMT